MDCAALRDAVLAIPEEVWNAQDSKSPIASWNAPQRGTSSSASSPTCATGESYDGPLWDQFKSLLEPVIEEAAKPYGYARGVFPRVMLARMAPRWRHSPARDQNLAAKWPHKVHVPLQTNDKVTFWVDGKAYHLPEGEAVEVNNMAVHAVENRGTTDRTHLIFEYYDAD